MEIEVKDLDYYNVELAICRAYDLGLPGSSDFTELQAGKSRNITIAALKGIIKCSVSAYKMKDSELYKISVGCVQIHKKKQ